MSAKWTEFRRRKSRRWWMTGATVAAVAVFGVVFAASSGAVINGFEGDDGNLVVNTAGNTDWASFPINCATGTGCSLDAPSGSSDNANTDANDPYRRVDDVHRWIQSNDPAIARRYGATWAIRAGRLYRLPQ